jgi:hypothetical protein
MNAVTTISKQTRRIAGVAAVVATLFTTGGTLALAEHYAQGGTGAQGYAAANPAVQQAAPAAIGRAQDGRAAA